MILECYNQFREGDLGYVPNGMNINSARMTMHWLDCMINTHRSFNRSGSLMQYRVILERIEQDYGSRVAREAALSQMQYQEEHNRQAHMMILNRFINI